MTPKDQKFLCTTKLNGIATDVYTIKNESGGYFYFCPEPSALPRIKIGLDHDEWWRCLAVAMHEAQEAVAAMINLRYRSADNDYSGENGLYTFHMDHGQFAEMNAQAAEFLAIVVPKLAAAWDRLHSRSKP